MFVYLAPQIKRKSTFLASIPDPSTVRAPYCGSPTPFRIIRIEVHKPEMANTFLVTAMLFLALSRALTVDATRNPSFLQSGVNGGTSCAVCAVVIGLAEQLTEVYNISVSEALSRFCSFLPSGFQEGCDALVDEFGPIVIELLENKETPDVVCQAIDLCKKDTEEVCHLFPLSQHSDRPGELNERIHRARQLAASIRKSPSNFR